MAQANPPKQPPAKAEKPAKSPEAPIPKIGSKPVITDYASL